MRALIEKSIEIIRNHLERHIPKKPEHQDGDPDCLICPNCRMLLNETKNCCGCGQKIDWSEE